MSTASSIRYVRHLSGNGLTAYSKDSTLPRSEKVQWAGLKGVVRVKHLLCHVKTVEGCDGSRVSLMLVVAGKSTTTGEVRHD